MMIPPTMIKLLLGQVRDSYTPAMGRDAADAILAMGPTDAALVRAVLTDVLSAMDATAPAPLALVVG